MSKIIILACLAACGFVSAQEFKCPEKNGFYPDSYQCDLYYKCYDGKAETKLCPDGLVFNDENPSKEKCDIPTNVDCGDRKELQEPQPTKDCPRQNGYYKHSDPLACDKFYYCADGVANEMPCPAGLIFDEDTSLCEWKETSKRHCDSGVRRDVLDDGFVCPEGETIGPNGRALPHPTYPHPDDCQKFYICRNGLRPLKGSCPLGQVYNVERFTCDDPSTVPGCEDYYGDALSEDKNKISKNA